jgi:hypothetical protein
LLIGRVALPGERLKLKLKNELSDCLADFRSARRLELRSALVMPIGAISAVVANALVWVIAFINLLFALRFAAAFATTQKTHPEQTQATTPAV